MEEISNQSIKEANMPETIIPISQLHTVGLIRDTPAVALPPNAFSDASNVRFYAGAVRKMPGEMIVSSPGFQGTGSIIFTTWWNNPNLTPTDGYFIVVRNEGPNDVLYAVRATDSTVRHLGVSIPTGGKWQSTIFQGGYAIVINNGVAKPFYVLDQTGNIDITALEAYELPGWDSYYTSESKINDVFDSDIHLSEFDLGENVDFITKEVVVTVSTSASIRKFQNRLTEATTVLQSTISLDPLTNTHIVTIALAAGGIGPGAFTDFLESSDIVSITLRSIPTVQVRAGVIRAWGDTLVAGNLVEINAPRASITDFTMTFPVGQTLSIGDVVNINYESTTNLRFNEIRTISSVTSNTASWSVALPNKSNGVANYTIVSSGTAIRNQPGVVRISDVAGPGSIPNNWNPYTVGVSTAEEFQLSTPGIVQDLVELQGNLYAYTNNSIHSLQRTSNSFTPYISSTISDSYGTLGIDCVKEFKGNHVVVGSNDIYQFSGHPASIQSIASGKVKEYFYKSINSSKVEDITILLNKNNSEIWFNYPKGTDTLISEQLVWNYENNVWSIRSMSNTTSVLIGPTKSYNSDGSLSIDVDPTVLRPILSSGDDIFAADVVGKYSLIDGTGYESYLERIDAAITPEFGTESVSSIALWTSSDAEVKPTLRFRIRPTDNTAEVLSPALSLGNSGPTNTSFTIGQDYKADVRVNGRFLNYRLTDESQTTSDWALSGMQLAILQGGKR